MKAAVRPAADPERAAAREARLAADEQRLIAELAACREALLRARVEAAVEAHPGASSNAIVERVRGDRQRVLAALHGLHRDGVLQWAPSGIAMTWRLVRPERPVTQPVCGIEPPAPNRKVGAR